MSHGSQQVVPEMLEGCDSDQQFSMGRAIVPLGLRHNLREERHWPFHSVDHLGQHGPNCDVGSVRVEYARLVGVRKGQGSSLLQGSLQFVKSLLGFVSPIELSVLPGQLSKRLSYICKIPDKTSVILG